MTWTALKRTITAFGSTIWIWTRVMRVSVGESAERKMSFCFTLQSMRREYGFCVRIPGRCSSQEMTNGSGVRYFAFPTPDALEELQDDQLKECGLGYRCRYVREAAKAVADGRLDLPSLRELDEETAMTTLTGLTGVGKKVASCVSLFGLHHLNSFPIDVWIKRILDEQYPNGYPFEDYSPYNGVYQQYMFDYYRKISIRSDTE